MQRNHLLYISSKSMTKIQPYIIPYICNSMRYNYILKNNSDVATRGSPKIKNNNFRIIVELSHD